MATGFEGSEGNYDDDEPMFLIGGGHAFAMRLSFPINDLHGPPTVEFHASLERSDTWTPMQGMRVFEDPRHGQVIISAAASTGLRALDTACKPLL